MNVNEKYFVFDLASKVSEYDEFTSEDEMLECVSGWINGNNKIMSLKNVMIIKGKRFPFKVNS